MTKHRFTKGGICTECRCSAFVSEKFNLSCPAPFLAHIEKDRWCSWCYQLTKHRRLRKGLLLRNDYVCGQCGNHTVNCRAPKCTNMACGSFLPQKPGMFEKVKHSTCNQFCSVHNGAIADFEKVHSSITDLSEYQQLLTREAFNYSKAGQICVGAVAAAAIVAPVALVAAPAIASAIGSIGVLGAASTGTAISSLSGAALTSASIAALGGSVAGGTFVVTAAGTALGAWQGGLIANAYAKEVKGFEVRKISQGVRKGPAIVCIDGFLTQGAKGLEEDWRAGLSSAFPENPWYHIGWESKALADLGECVIGSLHRSGFPVLVNLAKKAMQKPPGGITQVFSAFQLARNPWHVAMVKSMMTGALIADMLCRTTQKRNFILIGHSLGARVIFYALQALATRTGRKNIAHAILLGGAVGRARRHWELATEAVSGKIINCFSQRDDVLKCLYKFGTAFSSKPVGRGPIQSSTLGIVNVNVTDLVSGHTDYKPALAKVLSRVIPLLNDAQPIKSGMADQPLR